MNENRVKKELSIFAKYFASCIICRFTYHVKLSGQFGI